MSRLRDVGMLRPLRHDSDSASRKEDSDFLEHRQVARDQCFLLRPTPRLQLRLAFQGRTQRVTLFDIHQRYRKSGARIFRAFPRVVARDTTRRTRHTLARAAASVACHERANEVSESSGGGGGSRTRVRKHVVVGLYMRVRFWVLVPGVWKRLSTAGP